MKAPAVTIAVLAFASSVLHAQESRSLALYLQAGAGQAHFTPGSFAGPDAQMNARNSIGLALGIESTRPRRLSEAIELSYVTRGTRTNSEGFEPVEARLAYVDLSLLGRLTLPDVTFLRLRPQFGVTASILGSNEFVVVETQQAIGSVDMRGIDLSVMAGLRIGVPAVPSLFADLRYQYGIPVVVPETGNRNRSWLFSIGYVFYRR